MEVHVYSIVRFCLMNIVLDCVFCSGVMLILILLVVVLVKHFNFVPILLLVITIVQWVSTCDGIRTTPAALRSPGQAAR